MKRVQSILRAGLIAAAASMTACTHTDAAMLGAVIGHGLGTPLGTAAVAVEETFNTADDVVDANPRHASQHHTQTSRRIGNRTQADRTPPRDGNIYNDAPHHYRTEVLITTKGAADIQSIEVGETDEVVDFWQ